MRTSKLFETGDVKIIKKKKKKKKKHANIFGQVGR